MDEPVRRLTLDQPATYQIRVPGILDDRWSDWIAESSISIEREGQSPPVTTLTGNLDQAALHGLLRRIYAIGLPLISVNHIDSCVDNPPANG